MDTYKKFWRIAKLNITVTNIPLSGLNGSCLSCGNGCVTALSCGNGSVTGFGNGSVLLTTNGETSINGASYDNTYLPHEHPVMQEHSEGNDPSQVDIYSFTGSLLYIYNLQLYRIITVYI